jgi:hypothetical protein
MFGVLGSSESVRLPGRRNRWLDRQAAKRTWQTARQGAQTSCVFCNGCAALAPDAAHAPEAGAATIGTGALAPPAPAAALFAALVEPPAPLLVLLLEPSPQPAIDTHSAHKAAAVSSPRFCRSPRRVCV